MNYDLDKLLKSLQMGEKRKVPHYGCSSSNAMKVEHNEDGYSAYCFKCEKSIRFITHENNTLDSVVRIKQYRAEQKEIKDAKRRKQVKLPADCIHPYQDSSALSGLLWLKRYGIKDRDIDKYDIKWSNSMQRVIIPIGDRPVNDYVGRDVSGLSKMKYFTLGKATYFESRPELWSELCIVTEDILSAIKTGHYHNSFSMLGTKVSDELLNKITKYKYILVWSDNDKAGDTIYRKIHESLQWYPSIKFCRIHTPNDPKRYSYSEIRNIIYEKYIDVVKVNEASKGVL